MKSNYVHNLYARMTDRDFSPLVYYNVIAANPLCLINEKVTVRTLLSTQKLVIYKHFVVIFYMNVSILYFYIILSSEDVNKYFW